MRDLDGANGDGAALEIARGSLDQRLIDAHAADQKRALISLYAEAGDQMESGGDIDAACFYWTHARVYALELGDPRADELRHRLLREGREA